MSEDTDKRLVTLSGTLWGAQALLQMMTKRFPPIARHAHSITLFQGKLQLNLVHVAPCEKLTLDADDLNKPVAQLVLEIVNLMPKEPPKTAA
jgi:hypothetical protein